VDIRSPCRMPDVGYLAIDGDFCGTRRWTWSAHCGSGQRHRAGTGGCLRGQWSCLWLCEGASRDSGGVPQLDHRARHTVASQKTSGTTRPGGHPSPAGDTPSFQGGGGGGGEEEEGEDQDEMHRNARCNALAKCVAPFVMRARLQYNHHSRDVLTFLKLCCDHLRAMRPAAEAGLFLSSLRRTPCVDHATV